MQNAQHYSFRLWCGGLLIAEIPDSAAEDFVAASRARSEHAPDGTPSGIVLCPYRKTQLQKCSYGNAMWELHGIPLRVRRDCKRLRSFAVQFDLLYDHRDYPCVLHDDEVVIPSTPEKEAKTRPVASADVKKIEESENGPESAERKGSPIKER